jgi:ADP-heptose:LPS heptosyltransferase
MTVMHKNGQNGVNNGTSPQDKLIIHTDALSKSDLVDLVAQEVMDRIGLRERVDRLAKLAVPQIREQLSIAEPVIVQVKNTRVGTPRKIIIKHHRSPGDVLMLTAAVRDLSLCHPGKFLIDIRTPYPALWENNPHITSLNETSADVTTLECDYVDHRAINDSNYRPYHFIHAFRMILEEKLGVAIQPHYFKGDIHLRFEEKSWRSQVDEITGEHGTRFWLIDAGGKTDFTTKWWDPARYQAVVDHFKDRILFVQVGAAQSDHVHPELDGVINLVGKTDMRQMVRLMYHADGVICPVTMFMHLAAAVETKDGRSRNRPCVVVAGGREPSQWEAYPHHQFLHTLGMLPCCDEGGCWKSRVEKLNDGHFCDESICPRTVTVSTGRLLPECMEMITPQQVINAVEMYQRFESDRK